MGFFVHRIIGKVQGLGMEGVNVPEILKDQLIIVLVANLRLAELVS